MTDDNKEKELGRQLDQLRSKIVSAMLTHSEVRASDFAEWTDELRDYMINHVTWGSCYNDDGTYSLGRSFYNQFYYYEFCYQQVPFHSYTSNDGKDVIFTHTRREAPSDISGCFAVTVIIAAGVLGVALLFLAAIF